MPNNLYQNKVTAEPEIGSDGVMHSKVQGSAEETVSSAELVAALGLAKDTIADLKKELADTKAQLAHNNSDDSIDKLTKALTAAISGKGAQGPSEPDNINRADDFINRTQVDGRSLMESQQAVQMFKNEPKVPISIGKTYANYFGPALAVTVNGVRVSIPCDGKTYMINQTHATHARERIAKVDRKNNDTEAEIITTDA